MSALISSGVLLQTESDNPTKMMLPGIGWVAWHTSITGLRRVAVLVERSRYAESVGDTAGLGDDVRQVRVAVAERGRGWWRKVLPRSLWRGFWWKG